MNERTKLGLLVALFTVLYFVPIDAPIVVASITAGLTLVKEYARLHVLTCLVPAFFIAGTIAVYVKKDAIVGLLGPTAKKYIAYPVAGISGGILAVCSCTVLPLFTGIYTRGAGIGPAIAFLFTGPAINVTAILLTGNVLGWDFAVGRLLAAFVISVIAGMIMAFAFQEHDEGNAKSGFVPGLGDNVGYSNGSILTFFAMQLAVLIVFGLAIPVVAKWISIGVLVVGIVGMAVLKFHKEHNMEWLSETWGLTKKILPYLFIGVFLAGIIEVVVPQEFVSGVVGSNTIVSNFAASLFGAVMYFATLTEVPIIQKLMTLGMGRGPALTLLLTGNALSLPSIIVLVKIMGGRKTAVYVGSVVTLSALVGMAFGELV